MRRIINTGTMILSVIRTYSTWNELTRNTIILIISFILSVMILLGLGLEMSLTLSLMITLLIHELGHYAAMKYYRYGNIRIIFLGLAALTISDSFQESRFRRIVIALAGPIPGILLGWVMLRLFSSFPSIHEFALIMVIINTFNLIPFSLLDGGRIFEDLFIAGKRKSIALFCLASGITVTVYCILTGEFHILALSAINGYKGLSMLLSREKESYENSTERLCRIHILIFTAIWITALSLAVSSIFGTNF